MTLRSIQLPTINYQPPTPTANQPTTGRILNRFSRDTDIMDITLSYSLIQFVGCVTTYISILIVISIATKWFAIGLAPLTIVYLFIQRYVSCSYCCNLLQFYTKFI